MITIVFSLEGADDNFWECESPCVPRMGEHVRLRNGDGSEILEGEIVEVSWGQFVTGDRARPVPCRPPTVFIGVRGTVTSTTGNQS